LTTFAFKTTKHPAKKKGGKIIDKKSENCYTVPKAMDDFIVNNEKKKPSSYGMKSFIL
jgi:hypothetical protein